MYKAKQNTFDDEIIEVLYTIISKTLETNTDINSKKKVNDEERVT